MAVDDLNIMRQKIEASTILSAREKEEWLYLLPRMAKPQLDELNQILSIKMPAAARGAKVEDRRSASLSTPVIARRSADEAGSPGKSPDFLGWQAISSGLPRPDKIGARNDRNIQSPPLINPKVEARLGTNLEHIDALTLADLRKYPTPEAFMAALMQQIHRLTEEEKKTLQDVSTEFEKSPLYRTYLQSGLRTIAGNQQDLLSQSEFEAIADFRAQLRRKINS